MEGIKYRENLNGPKRMVVLYSIVRVYFTSDEVMMEDIIWHF